MTFSFYHSLKSRARRTCRRSPRVYRFSWWQRFKWVELPFATTGLVWNSMMSMAGGWFFLMINEALRARRPGLPPAGPRLLHERGRRARATPRAMVSAVVAMVLMIVALDQLLWRPVVVWAQRFRVEETRPAEASQELVPRPAAPLAPARRRVEHWRRHAARRRARRAARRRRRDHADARRGPRRHRGASHRAGPAGGARSLLIGSLGALRLVHLLAQLPPAALVDAGPGRRARRSAACSCRPPSARPGPCPRASPSACRRGSSRLLQPVVQVVASFPAPMLFPAGDRPPPRRRRRPRLGQHRAHAARHAVVHPLQRDRGRQRPSRRPARGGAAFGFDRWQRFWTLYLPAIFPYLVTGWVTAAGGAWNASIVVRVRDLKGDDPARPSASAPIVSQAAERAQFAAAGRRRAGACPLIVVAFNRLVWRRCYRLAETRYSLTK